MKPRIAALVGVIGLLGLVSAAQAAGPTPGIAQGGDGITIAGGARLVAIAGEQGSTIVMRMSTKDGAKIGQRILHGTLGIPLVTYSGVADAVWANGRRALLSSSLYDDPRHTTFVVLDTRSLRPLRTISLRGSFAYDAISPSGHRLYVLQFPNGLDGGIRYVVRSVNMTTGLLEPGVIVDKTEPDEQMSGFPLARVANTRSGWIYTLYSRGESNAFIHALDTRHRVARCIDLPWKGAAQNVLQRAVLSLEHGKLMLRQPRGDLLAAIDLRSFGVTT